MAAPLQRPWFRLGSLTRQTATTSTTPVTEQPRPVPARIRPSLIRPTGVAAEPSIPATPKQSAKSPPHPAAPQTPLPKKEASPPPPVAKASRSSGDTAAAQHGSPTHSERYKDSSQHLSPVPSPSSPKSFPATSLPSPLLHPPTSPYQSPKPKAAASLPPSPLLLPPPQLRSDAESKHDTIPQEVERKTVVFQKVVEKQEQKRNDIKQEKEKRNNEAKKAEEKDSNTRFITMAGENRGASMEVILSSDKNNNNSNKIIESQNEDKEGKKKSTGTRNVRPMKSFCNNNVQGINNSILMNSEFSHHDPGIHLVFSTIPFVDDEDDNEEQQ